ncbi:GAF domain-containing protein [Perlabentimonas gracilis]|uniref:GAF domain-containing protein n=1 Tax=Perlabentimonas gracilis TaxID=2715279 RepID=UPI00140B5E70|nr:GAF domain-containing protein [Perlabentimonas gracilis]NHB69586.1 GAF domain-containing protein [Perlabentimonas gracilis]
MKVRLNIRQKIFLSVLSVSMVLYVVAVGYIVTSSRKAMLDDAFLNARNTAKIVAEEIEKEFERDLAVTRTLAQAFTVYQDLAPSLWQELFMKMYVPVLEGNKHVYSIWDSWEYYGFVPNYDKEHGRYCMTVWREDNRILTTTDERSMTGDPDKYGAFKQKNREGLWEPYFDEIVKGKSDRVLMTTVASPIQIKGKYFGLVGFDISLESLQDMISKIEPVPGSFAFLLSSEGIIAAHPNTELINQNLSEVYADDFQSQSLGEVIREGREHSYIKGDGNGESHYVTYAPIQAGDSYSTWSLALSIPMSVITERAYENQRVSLLVGAGGLLLLMLVLILVSNGLTRPIVRITKSLNRMQKGEISGDLILSINSGDEIGVMANALNTTIEGLNKKTAFADDIGKGHLESNLDLLGENDVLGKSLLAMRNSLKKAKEDEAIRIAEDNKRTWANEGYAKFAEILRQNNEDLQTLVDEVLKNLVKYLGGNQGALFLVNDDDKKNVTLEAKSVYAWDRKKFVDTEIMMGEGLIGACALEGESIFLTEIPDNFVTINSGLGEANPSCILLVPLKQNETVLGVIEVASFKVFEQFEVDFLEKIAESIASTVATVKINAKTRFLLEQSQQQAEEMQAQEEEMRQNMEELLATQEEMSRKEKEITWTMEAIGGLAMVIEYDFKGVISFVNPLLCTISGYTKEELLGQHHSILFEHQDVVTSAEYNQFLDDMRNNKSFKNILKRKDKQGNIFTVKAHCYPIFDEEGTPLKVVEVSVDITELVGK